MGASSRWDRGPSSLPRRGIWETRTTSFFASNELEPESNKEKERAAFNTTIPQRSRFSRRRLFSLRLFRSFPRRRRPPRASPGGRRSSARRDDTTGAARARARREPRPRRGGGGGARARAVARGARPPFF